MVFPLCSMVRSTIVEGKGIDSCVLYLTLNEISHLTLVYLQNKMHYHIGILLTSGSDPHTQKNNIEIE